MIWVYRIFAVILFIITFNSPWFLSDVLKKEMTANETWLYTMIVALGCAFMFARVELEDLKNQKEEGDE